MFRPIETPAAPALIAPATMSSTWESLLAGGPPASSDSQVLDMVAGAISAGAAGVSIGRNIFQHKNPTAMTKAIKSIVHGGSVSLEVQSLLDESNERIQLEGTRDSRAEAQYKGGRME